MLAFLGNLGLGIVFGTIIGGVIHIILDGGFNFRVKGSQKYNKFNKDSDERVKEMLRSGPGSTREELQEWWDTYHPPK